MALNGLDDVKVREAYDVANSEPGGWFLLKYASRDEVEILDTGVGGISDIRAAIAGYAEPSPLYGFLRYRRRSVIIKYIPENCSRLIQARAAVHFNAICDQFIHNTTFEITDAKELKDSKLSAACSLHAASGSSSSSNSSLRRRRLNEIAEEEEEEERERKRQSVLKEEDRPASSIYSDVPISPSPRDPPVVLDRLQITDPSETTFASTKNLPDFTGAHVPTSPTKSESGRRLSSQSARHEVYSSASYTQGRKIKLGPRPSLDAHKRPLTTENFRPIAALPAGFKFFKGSKKGKSQEQGRPEQVHHVTSANVTAPGSLLLSTDDQLPPRPATSSGASIKSTAPSVTLAREGKMTPEKARLMKAMKLREKKMQDAKAELSSPTKYKSVDDTAEAVPNGKSDKPPPVQVDSTSPTRSTIDSSVGLPISAATKPEAQSRDGVLDSHPSSPGAASSTGIGDSTKASSLSDLTDETIQASKESVQDNYEEVKKDAAEFLDMQKIIRAELANTSQSKTIDADVSDDQLTKGAGKFVQIPGNDTNISEPAEAMIRKSIEPNDFTPVVDSRATSQENESLEKYFREVPANLAGSAGIDQDPSNITGPPQASDQSGGELGGKGNVSIEQLGVHPSTSTSNAAKSPTLPISPTAPSLKSKFSRKDVAVPTESTLPTLDKTIAISPAADYELPRPGKTIVDPICTDLPAKGAPEIEASDPLDDDALMDELQTATVQEAKPMLVSKSPITPVFPSPSSPTRKDPRLPRAASNPMRSSLLMPVEMSHGNAPRSVSSGGPAFLNSLTRNPSNASIQSKKGNVGSSISQRIKALEALSGGPNDDRPRPTTPSSTFFTVRKQGTREPSKSPSVVDRASSITQQPPTPESSREPTPEAPSSMRERSGSVASRLTMFEGQNAPRGRPESIQVTARIIRGATSPFANLSNSSRKLGETAPAELRQSTLLVDIHRAQSVAPQPFSERPPVAERPKTSVPELQDQKPGSGIVEKQAKRRSSMSLMKNFIKEHTPLSNKSTEQLIATSPAPTSLKSPSRPPSVHQTSSSFVRRLSTSSRRSSFNQEGDNASMSAATRSSSRVSDSGSAEDDKSLSDKKSKNRTSRFMRRLSNSFGGARKSGSATISPTVTEEDADQLEKISMLAKQQVASPTIVAFMGDVNVQFPDNLLWKRRSMCLDAQGFLFLSMIQGGAKKGKETTGTKRFHLGDFRRPYIPDVEVQELPNSVVLDFLEGSSLQIACGDRAGQQNVLRTLQEAHQSHAASN
ncbi:hypothetical protein GQX73_g7269 [Xylaria multiplex]|uniref:ADF-H domain-containing protein n=1 Tax=Xylaria multiplex TaxID=323545 RepID=A0A7C8IXV5_9PEZI|nr:hypothetical protein GQX73_g7269 [Xylaria multiplex]